MRTVSTKLDSKTHNKFVELCNEQGKCQSEFLRDTIESIIEDIGFEQNREATPQDLEQEHTNKEPTPEITITTVYD